MLQFRNEVDKDFLLLWLLSPCLSVGEEDAQRQNHIGSKIWPIHQLWLQADERSLRRAGLSIKRLMQTAEN